MKKVFTAVVLLCSVLTIHGFSQGNSTIGGTVQDATGAFIPGVTIIATNTITGVAAETISNESGAYQFPGLQLGTYTLVAELPGFATQTVRDYQLGGSAQARINFTMQVGSVTTDVQVSVAADSMLTTSSNSVGTVLPEYKIRDLPVSTRNVFNLVATTPGVQSSGGTIGIMAGGRLGDVNATRDGVNVNDGRYENGAWSVVYSSPDLVEEVKVVVAPVDAETSRGSGQVSMVTRSGGNVFRGSAFWVNHNSALDANGWFDNYNGIEKSYDNRNQFGGRFAGPIIRNKTFFFALFEGQRDMKRSNASGLTLTDMARQGIFRYFPGVDNANANATNPTVDRSGNPVRPAAASGDLAAIDVFGNCTFRGAPVANCRTFRDPLRPAISTNPYMLEAFKRMPSPNEFTSGDGLNTANIRFVRRQEGLDLTNGNGDEVNRDQYNARIDHNFNANHKLSLIGTHEKTWGTATQAGLRAWPEAYDGLAVKRPYVYSIQFTSTLSSSLLNQIRLSKRASNNWQWGAADRGDEIGAEARQLAARASGIPFQVGWATGIPTFVNIGGFGRWREGINPMRSVGDDLSWTTGKHAFKMGFEWRRQESNGFNDPNYTPSVTMGVGSNAVTGLDGTAFPGLTGNAGTLARNLLADLSGSVASINQAFGVVSSKETKLVSTPLIRNNAHWNKQSELSSFFKDDWKFSPSITLNLGMHWEWYGQPWEHNGLAARVIGDENTFLNVSCSSDPGNRNFRSTCSNLVEVQFVGNNSPHPELSTNLKGNDLNNFAPAVGFSWSLPWFGKDKTVIRSGYGISYLGAARNFITVDGVIGTVPGINHVSGGSGLGYTPAAGQYTSLNTLTLPIPFPTGSATVSPFLVQPTQRSLGITTYNHVSPYTQNWNFEIQRELARNTTLEVRYIGSKGTKIWGNVNLNAIDTVANNPALFAAFNTVRAGGESALLNQILMGHTFPGQQTVNGTTWTAAMAVRTLTATRQDLARGNVGSFVNRINTNLIGGDNGSVLRNAGFAENYIIPSPQYGAVNIAGNESNSKYHSLQMQFTKRLSAGFTNTTAWTWSKAMTTAGLIDPSHRGIESTLQGTDRKHQITSNGTWELPFGTGHFLLGNAPGVIQQIVNGWQLGGIVNYNTGSPISLESGIQTIGTAGARSNVVGDVPTDMGKVTKVANGVQYFQGYTQITDPGIANITTLNGLTNEYTNKAIVAPNGQVILVNPLPGQVGTYGENTLRGPGSIRFDMNMVKRFRVTETKDFELRLDAINVLNTPNWNNPSTDINGNNNFGNITGASGARSFITNLRFNF